MAYELLKEEAYKNLGGINVNDSIYTTQETQVLDLRNYTFVRPGAWTQRPGTAASYSLAIATFATKPTTNMEYVKNDGSSYQIFDSGANLYLRPSNTAIYSSLVAGTSGLLLDSVIQNDFLYFCNGKIFNRYDGTVTILYNSVDPVGGFFTSVTFGITFSTSLIPENGLTVSIPTGNHYFFLGGYRNDIVPPSFDPTSYEDQLAMQTTPDINLILDGAGVGGGFKNVGSTIVGQGRWLIYGFTLNTTPLGLSAAVLEYAPPGTSFLPGTGVFDPVFNSTALLIGFTTINGSGQFFVEFDHYLTGVNVRKQEQLNLYPKYIETFNNMLFMAGFSGTPSTVWWSNPGAPEQVDEENNTEIRSSNGDQVTGMAVFQDALVVFKNTSVHEFTGSDPDSLILRDLNLEYGCLSNRGIVSFNNLLWFVDRKGIVEYNGANFKIVSNPIDQYLDLVDKSKLVGIHVKKKDQVWFAADQTVFVFDYVSGAWTIFDRLQLERDNGVLNMSYGSTTTDVTWWETGTSFHNSVRFNDSLVTDQGQNITLVSKTRYHKRLGETTEELWRRYYLNINRTTSALSVTLEMMPNYGTSVYLTRGFTLTAFQKRIDFGVPARSLSFRMILKPSERVQVNGYTVESRYLRSV